MEQLKRYCLALDLRDDPALIAEYEEHHRNVWPEIKKSILDSGIVSMEIYRVSNRLFMIMETDGSFSFDRKGAMDAANPRVQQWEDLMWKYQQPLPVSRAGEKWVLMQEIFSLKR
jgi:L-rhamnose mutarotase